MSPGPGDACADGVVSDDGVGGDAAAVAPGRLTVSGGVTGVAAGEHLRACTTRAGQRRARLDAGQVNHNILVVDQVPGAVQRALHIAAKRNVRRERLLNGLHREVGVLVVPEPEERNAWARSKVRVKSAKGD